MRFSNILAAWRLGKEFKGCKAGKLNVAWLGCALDSHVLR